MPIFIPLKGAQLSTNKVFVLMLTILTILTGSFEPRAQNGCVSALFATIKLCPWAPVRKWASSCGGHGQEIKS